MAYSFSLSSTVQRTDQLVNMFVINNKCNYSEELLRCLTFFDRHSYQFTFYSVPHLPHRLALHVRRNYSTVLYTVSLQHSIENR